MAVKKVKAKKMIKIVYFDEGSATDFIYVLAGGKSTDKKEHIVTKSSELAVGAEAEASKSAGLFSMISAKIGVDGNVDFAREETPLFSKAIEYNID